MKKKQSIDNILNSLENIQKAPPPIDLFDKINQQLASASSKASTKIIPLSTLRLAAASMLLLVMMNIWSINNYINKNKGEVPITAKENAPSLILSTNLYEL